MTLSPPRSSLYQNPIPFSHFASLISHLSACTAKKRGRTAGKKDGEPSRQRKLMQAWVDGLTREHGADLPHGTVVLFFRLFFPDVGVRRRYGFQEKTLADALEALFKVRRRGTFAKWAEPSLGGCSKASGCLGEEVKRWMEQEGRGKGKGGELTMGRVDELLDELASSSSYSAEDVRSIRYCPTFRPRPTSAILSDLLLPLTASEAALMIQLLLRDLSPLLYPAPSSSAEAALARYNTLAYDHVTVGDAMKAWHPGMARLFLAVADLDWVAWEVEEAIPPRVGLPVKTPKTEKPGCCSRATKYLKDEVAVETKYDGERLQIHIDMSLPPDQQIRIFSKSGRDSTQTRHLLLPIIRAALSLPLDPYSTAIHPLLYQRLLACPAYAAHPTPPSKLILEGEMVPYDETRGVIDEFWKLDCAKAGYDAPPPSTAGLGRRGKDKESYETGETGKTPSPFSSGPSPASGGGRRPPDLHLMVVWFDALLVGEESLLDEPYRLRRARLESLVQSIEGFSQLASSVLVNFSHAPSALENLRLRFAHIIAKRCEGLMLKPLDSMYNDMQRGMRWVKLKKDFIPGAGDTLDFHVVGASWQKERGRELLVPPSVYTTFFVGLLAPDLGPASSRSSRPHLHILFSASYGLNREQLAKLCADIRTADGGAERFDYDGATHGHGEGVFRQVAQKRRRGGMPVYESACTTFTFSLAPHLRSAATRPSVIFRKPRVMELNGAGFQRTTGSPYYELRFPRITKPNRPDVLTSSALSLAALQSTAERAMSAAPTDAASVVAALWNCAASPGGKGGNGETEEEKYEREVAMWVRRLEAADGVLDRDREGEEGARGRLLSGTSKQTRVEVKMAPPVSPQLLKTVGVSPAKAQLVVLSARSEAMAGTASSAWSLFPPLPASYTLPEPRHPHLDASNFLPSALSVLWSAGHVPPSYSTSPFAGEKRQGFVFVDEGTEGRCMEWLQGELKVGRRDGARLVWVVRRRACEEKGEYGETAVVGILC
ncbi:hypothetical protein JCM10213v2_004115 [Rhodosporidiobolus nylandii]